MKRYRFVRVVAFGIAALALCGCKPAETHRAPWDKKITGLIVKAGAGDTKAAADAYFYCVDPLLLDQDTQPSAYVGPCGGIMSLWISNALEEGDPDHISALFVTLGRSASPEIHRRLPFYRRVAMASIKKRCAAPGAPSSCGDKPLIDSIETGTPPPDEAAKDR